MAGDGKIKRNEKIMTIKDIVKELNGYTKKLETGDITKYEADRIYYDFIASFHAAKMAQKKSFVQALCRWYEQVEKKLPEPGNYVTTIPFSLYERLGEEISKAIKACFKKLDPADTILFFKINEEMSPLIEEKLRKKDYIASRAGEIRQALGSKFDDLVPVIKGIVALSGYGGFCEEIVGKAEKVTPEQVYGTLVSYIVYNSGVPAIDTYSSSKGDAGCTFCRVSVFSKDLHLFSFIPPAEEVFNIALNAGIIDRETAKRLMSNNIIEIIEDFPLKKFVEQMSGLLTMKSRIKKEKQEILEDSSWTEIIR